ncbi:MAG: haloacid dehalogenase type II [Pirellulaceae bacterium]|jgi:2-haloacid dehalogenase|nr:haloacid dehalogenase type II [Pirellulaceae bacterium]MDP7016785.1 haloacid dehalogenase type II [Pirellulaceae bacterium]
MSGIRALTFDLFGTVLDLAGSLTPAIEPWLRERQSNVAAAAFWAQWRARQRIEQYQDTIMMLGHSGYLRTARRALVYVSRLHGVDASDESIDELMKSWWQLSPFPEVTDALEKMSGRYQLVALSNGNADFLRHLVDNRIRWPFADVISVDVMGAFKPHPAVYRRAAQMIGVRPHECMMISANSFDVAGAKACGYSGAFVNRLQLPFEDSPYQPDVEVGDFTELAEAI